MAGIFEALFVLLFLIIMVTVLTAQDRAKKRKTKGRSQRPQVQFQATPSMGRTAGPVKGEGHDHIKSTELPHDRKMEQLKTLKDAGLLTQEEYNQRYQKILKGR